MVYLSQRSLDRTFAALADPTRRALLAQLGEHAHLSVSELARPFTMSLPAVMKHLDVLSDAGLIAREKTGRTVVCRLQAAPMAEATDWLNRYEKFWSERLDRLAAFLEEEEDHVHHHRQARPHPYPPAQGPSGAGLQRLDGAGKSKALVRPGGAQVTLAEFDTRKGGRYRIVARSPDGDEHDVGGVFREVIPDEKLVYTWAWRSTPERESLVTVEFRREGDRHAADAPARGVLRRAGARPPQAGWNGALDKLETYLA